MGLRCAQVRTTPPGPSLLWYHIRALLGVTKDGLSLGLCDENGKVRASLKMLKDGPLLGLSDENEKVIWRAP